MISIISRINLWTLDIRASAMPSAYLASQILFLGVQLIDSELGSFLETKIES